MAVRGPVTCLSLRDGDVAAALPGGEATGLFVDDRRVLHTLRLTLDGRTSSAVAAASTGGTTETYAVARHLGDPGPDPTVEVSRRRVLHDRGLHETVTVRNRWSESVGTRVEIRVAGDGAELYDVKHGVAEPTFPPVAVGTAGATWSDDRHVVLVHGEGATTTSDDEGALLVWDVEVPSGGEVDLVLDVRADRTAPTPFDTESGFGAAGLDGIRVVAQDARLGRTVEAALDDLRHLAMRDPLAPDDVFAGRDPWYLTLFGRDSLWAARLALPFGTDLARGTLRALARRQGTVDDAATAQEPGKILHEVRRTAFGPEGGMVLPTVYYGTVDATPLWVCVLHDAWRWGLPADVVRELAPALRAALGWMERAAAESPDGLLRYLDESGTGLANQGWKDSGDSMRDAAGRVADGPIALVETQAYAVEAAHGAAALLEEVLGEDGSAWRAWGDALAARVREHFWVRGDGAGRRCSPWRSTAPAARSTGSGATSATPSRRDCSTGPRAAGWRTPSPGRTSSAPSASARSRAPTRPSTRSGTTRGRCGRTTARSAPSASRGPATSRERRRSPALSLTSPRRAGTAGPSCTAPSRCSAARPPTRRAAVRRPGPRPAPEPSSRCSSGCAPTCRPDGSTCRHWSRRPSVR